MKLFLTGASDGIGGATCVRFAEAAAAAGTPLDLVVTTSGRKGPPAALLERLATLGARCRHLTGDLADADTCADLATQALDHLGGLDVFVSNAGAPSPGPLADLAVETWDRMFAVNVRPTFVMAQRLRPALMESRGAIVAVSSMSGQFPHRNSGAYSAAKAALSMLCRNLAQEWAPDGIRVNAVAPGMVDTPLTAAIYEDAAIKARREALVPMGRIATPEDIAAVIAFLAGPGAAYISGQVILADGGVSESALGTIPGLPRP